GPPLFSGGNLCLLDIFVTSLLLQWGRRCSAAEMIESSMFLANRDGLQWGRRCSAAEIAHREADGVIKALLQWGRRCSAAEMKPTSGCGRAPSGLQWGRRCSAAEIPPTADADAGCALASMGPPLFSGGNRRRAGHERPTPPSFNGAAAVQRRKFWHRGERHRGSTASMGPPLFSGGNPTR